MIRLLSIQFVVLFALVAASKNAHTEIPEHTMLFDFRSADELADWVIVNDGVMGGLSRSEMTWSDDNTAVFSGALSLENNGGFSLCGQGRPPTISMAIAELYSESKGDGRTYQFRLRTDERFDGYAYRSLFETTLDRWMDVRIPFAQCVPVFRGRILSDVGPLVPQQIQQIGFLIADKQEGSFRLEIDWIKAYRHQ